jgi:hypothetical protein
LAEAIRIFCEDQEDYIPPATVSQEENGVLLTRSTVDAYVVAVMELWCVQMAYGSKTTDNPYGAAVRGFLEQCS